MRICVHHHYFEWKAVCYINLNKKLRILRRRRLYHVLINHRSWLSLFSLRLYRSNECSQLQLSHTNTKAPFWEKISTITIKREPLYCGQGALNSYTRRVYLYIYWILHTHKLSIWTPSFLLSGKWINIWIIWADRDFFQGRDGTCILLIQSICRLKPHFIACFWFSKMTF